MSSRYRSRQADNGLELMDLPDAEETYSSDEGDISQREYNDLRLTQAINYMAEEGGNDSPATYMSRIDRIDEALVHLLPEAGHDFDTELYHTVRAMVREVQQAYDHAVQVANPPVDSAGTIPKYYTPSASEVLYRADDGSPGPSTKRFRMSPRSSAKSVPSSIAPAVKPLGSRIGDSQNNVDLERDWKYGGPNTQVEQWYRNMPASLPFPETHQLEHWESLKMNFDISDYGKKLKAEGKVVETNIPFHRPALEQYKNLHHLDSGSKFKLPHGIQADYDAIRKLATKKLLTQTVNEFNEGNRAEEEALDYAPRIYLERFSVGRQASPAPDLQTALRDALRRTPTKSTRSHAGITPSTTGSKNAESKAAENARARIAAVRVLREKADVVEQGLTDTKPSSHSKPVTKSPSVHPRSRRNATPSTGLHTPARPTAPVRPSPRAGAAMRKFGDEREKAISESPRRESVFDGAGSTPESPHSTKATPRAVTPKSRTATSAAGVATPSPKGPTPSRVATSSARAATPSPRAPTPSPKAPTPSPKAPTPTTKSPPQALIPIVKKRGRGRPRKNLLPSTPALPAAAPTPRCQIVDLPGTKTSTKRKRSLGSEHYTPDGKRKKSLGSEDFTPPLTKTLRSATRDRAALGSGATKKVGFVEISSGSESESVSDGGDGDEVEVATKRPAVRLPVAGPVAGVSKAVAAGQRVKKRIIRETVVVTTGKVRKIVPGKVGTTST